jgi:hypothetical protein
VARSGGFIAADTALEVPTVDDLRKELKAFGNVLKKLTATGLGKVVA